jgi:hypothetical protein
LPEARTSQFTLSIANLLISEGSMKTRAGFVVGAILLAIAWGGSLMFRMPGRSHSGPLPPLTKSEKVIQQHLEGIVRFLSDEIGERNVWQSDSLDITAQYLERAIENLGYPVRSEEFPSRGKTVRNLVAEIPGTSQSLTDEIVVVGAHYDTVAGSPGADDNATGVAAIIEIARLLRLRTLGRTVRFVAFVNEEPPFFQTESMGSFVHARHARDRGDNIIAMLSIESIGYYLDEPGSQQYPPGLSRFYPNQGDFITFVSNVSSGRLVRRSIESFRKHAQFPSEGIAAPAWIPGLDWSDQWAFWKHDYRAIMVTDTAVYRHPGYHTNLDTPEKIDYARAARVVRGLAQVVADLASHEIKKDALSEASEKLLDIQRQDPGEQPR